MFTEIKTVSNEVKSKIDFKSGTALLEFDENKATEKQIINTIKKLGYSA